MALYSWAKSKIINETSGYTRKKAQSLSNSGNEKEIKLEARGDLELVCKDKRSDEDPFYYFYDTCFIKLGLHLPFATFDKKIILMLNVAPTQQCPHLFENFTYYICLAHNIVSTANKFF